MLLRVLEVVFPIFSIVLFAIWFGHRFRPDLSIINRINMDVFLPALTFHVIVSQAVDVRAFAALSAAVGLVIVGSGLLAWPMAKLLRIEWRTFVPPMMFGNAGNVGLPLFVLAFGERALPLAIVLIFVQNLIHFSLGVRLLDRTTPLLGLLRSPLIVVTLIALALSTAGVRPDDRWLLPVKMLGDICVPLLLFALGVRLASVDLSYWRVGLAGALVSPLLGLALAAAAAWVLPLQPLERGVMLLFGALPPAVMNFMFAERYSQEPAKVASIVAVGHIVSFVVLPIVLAVVLPRDG